MVKRNPANTNIFVGSLGVLLHFLAALGSLTGQLLESMTASFFQVTFCFPKWRSLTLKTPKRVIGKNLEYDIPDLGLRLVTSAEPSHGVES